MMYRLLLILVTSLLIVSCSKENKQELNTDNYLNNVSLETRSGPNGCFEIIFPIEFNMPDESIISADSFEEAKTEMKDWYQANPDSKEKPSLVYPIELLTEEGQLISIDHREELKEIIIECKKEHFGNHHKRCFKVIPPLSIIYPDGMSIAYDKWSDLKKDLRDWKIENPNAVERPHLEFPIQIIMDGETSPTEVFTKEELKEIKENCN